MALTDVKIRAARPKEKPRKLFDAHGLYLLITPQGARYWRLKYYFQHKEKLLALGTFPDVSLKQARDGAAAARVKLSQGIDPMAERRAARSPATVGTDTFEAVAREWHSKHAPNWIPKHAADVLYRLEKNIFPWLGARPIAEIGAPELLSALRRVEERGAGGVARRLLQYSGRVCRFAVATGRAQYDPAAALRGALAPAPRVQHRAAVTEPREVGALMRAINGYKGGFVTRCALKLTALTFLRSGELRRAEWGEIDLDSATWRVPAARMKMRAEHIVPLSKQAVAVLRELQPLTGHGKFVFPGVGNPNRPLSDGAVLMALRRMDYGPAEMCVHGFRGMASTLLHELGYNSDHIERQLAHVQSNAVRAAYDRSQFLDARRAMMQKWADHLDRLASLNNDGAGVASAHVIV